MKKIACFMLFVLCAQANATSTEQTPAACAEALADTIVNNPFFGLLVMAVGIFAGLRLRRRRVT